MRDFYSLYFKDTPSATVFGDAVLNTKRRKAMSYTVPTLSLRNLEEVFGQINPLRRRAAIDEILHEDAVFHDPNGGIYYGRDEIDRIAGVIKGNHPDFRYQPISPPEEMEAGQLDLGQPWQAAGLRRHRFHYGPGRQNIRRLCLFLTSFLRCGRGRKPATLPRWARRPVSQGRKSAALFGRLG